MTVYPIWSYSTVDKWQLTRVCICAMNGARGWGGGDARRTKGSIAHKVLERRWEESGLRALYALVSACCPLSSGARMPTEWLVSSCSTSPCFNNSARESSSVQ
jgi:hypothetical protein